MLDRVLMRLRVVLVLILLGAAIWIAWLIAGTLQEGRMFVRNLDGTRQRVEALVTDANRVVLSVGGTAAEIRKAAKEQRELTAQTTRETNAAIARANSLIANLDANLNQKLLPEATKAVAGLGVAAEAISSTSESANATLEGLKPTLENLALASKGAADRMNDPALAQTQAELARMAKSAADVGEDAAEASEDIKVAVKKVTKPANLVWSGFKLLADWTLKALAARR